MNILLDLQYADDLDDKELTTVPSQQQIAASLNTALSILKEKNIVSDNTVEISVRIVSKDESQILNTTYRDKSKPTNVLSFGSEIPDYIESDHIGDLVICAKVVEQEALEQNKKLIHHWTHMLIHGLLHLLGFDHIDPIDAEAMEGLEVIILNQLGIDDPYTTV